MPYIGAEPTAHHGINSYKYIASGGSQTTFPTSPGGADADGAVLSYDVGDGSCQVFLNGIKLDRSDITATNSTQVVLAACTDGDIVHVQAVKALTVGDVVAASTGGTFSGAVVAPSLTLSSTPLAVASGGSGAATHTANGVLLGAGTGAMTTAAPSTSGNVLTSNGTVWASATPSGGASATVEVSYNTTTATGTLAVTGFGFQPKSIIVFAIVGSNVNTQNYGAATDGGISINYFGQGSGSAGQWDNHNQIIRLAIDGSNRIDAAINSWDADGITLGITKTGSPTGYMKAVFTGFKV